MRLIIVSVLVSMIFALGVVATSVDAETISTNLTLGSRGEDVVTLQQFLVAKGYLVMPAGVAFGYFGPLTKEAVAKWQADNGISPAVGYFGPISRSAFAKQTTGDIAQQAAPPPSLPVPISQDSFPNIETDTPTASGMRANRVMLFRVYPFEVRPGDMIELEGSGFSKTQNKVYFNGNELATSTSTNGTSLEVRVPANLTEGEYRLSVSNVLGSSDNPDIKVILKVTNNPQPSPTIQSATLIGDTVTLTGSGFTSSNKLYTTLGDSSSSVSSSGEMLTFRLTDLSRYSQTKQFTQGKYQAYLWIYVENEHGINKDPYKLEIII